MENRLHQKYRGIIPPVLTPFNEDKSVDFQTLEKFVDWLCQQKVDILFPMGGSGEYQTLQMNERKQIIDSVVKAAGGRKQVFAGTGSTSLQETLELSRYAAEHGADGVGVVMPTDIPGNEESLFTYYKAVNDAVNCPFMVYDPRGEGPHSATPKLMRRMVDALDKLVAIKYRTVNGEYMGCMAREISDDISLFSGAETVFLQDLSVGAIGCVGGGANFYPELIRELQDRFLDSDILGARKVQYKILEATAVLENVYWPLSGKIVLQELGFPFKLVTRVEGRAYTEEDVSAIRVYYRELLNIPGA